MAKIIHLFLFGVNVKVGHFSPFPSYFHPRLSLLLGKISDTFNSHKLPVVNPNQCVLCFEISSLLEMYKRSFPIGYRQTPLVLPLLSPLSVLYPSFLRRASVSGSSTFPFSTSGFRSIIGRRPNFNM